MDILFEGATIVTMDSDRRVIEGDILLRGSKIAAVGQDEGLMTENPVLRRIDSSGKIIIPGLVQSHTHLCQTLFRGMADGLGLLEWLRDRVWPLEGAHDFESMRASARLGIAELIRGGTTACLDMGSVHHTNAVFEAAVDAGFRLTSGKAMMDEASDLPDSLHETTDQSLANSDELYDAWHGREYGRLRYAYAPRFVLSCSEQLLREVALRARNSNALIHTHASENPKEIEAVRAKTGMDNVEYLDSLGIGGENVALAHCIWLSKNEEDLLAQSGTHLLHCPSCNLKLGSGLAKIPELLGQGVSISLGADGAPCNNNLDMWMEMRLASLIHLPRVGPAGLSAQDVFEMATLGGAAAMGQAEAIGSIEVGKRADMVVVDLDCSHALPAGDDIYGRLVYSGKSSDVETVVIDGDIVMERGVLKSLNVQDVKEDAKRGIDRVLRRL